MAISRGIARISSAVSFRESGRNHRSIRKHVTEQVRWRGDARSGARSARRVAAPSSANDVLEVTAANKNQALSLARVICGR